MSARASAERATLLVGLMAGLSLAAPTAKADDDVTVRGSQSAGFSGRSNVEDAPREITDAASLIEPMPGVHVRRLGADDSFATLSIRGSSSNEVSVVVAGVPLTDAADPTLDLSSLPLWPDASVRVFRSFTPATVGPGSLGGTLVLDPPRAFGPSKSEVWGAVGSFGSARLRVSDLEKIGFGNGRDAYVVAALSASRADDDFSYFDPATKSDAERVNAQHAAVNGLVSVALPVDWTRTSHGIARITTIVQSRKQGVPGTIEQLTPLANVESSRVIHVVELSGPAASGNWFARLYGRRDDARTRSANDPFSPTDANDVVLATGASTGFKTKVANRFSLATTLDASAERFAPGATFGLPQEAGASRTLAGIGADLDFRATKSWTISASARGDVWHDAADAATTSATATSSANGTEAHPTAHLGTEIAVGPVTFAAHGGALARPASFVERYGSRGAFLGDPSLSTETAWTADVGARTSWHMGIFRGRFELAGFSTWADDLITFLPTGAYGLFKATNVGRARIAGTEADLALFVVDFSLHVSYTGLDTANETLCESTTNDGCARPQLPGRPAHDLFSDLSYRIGPAVVRYGVDVVAGMTVDNTGSIPNPARVLHSAGARLDVPHVKGLRVALDLRNLFDLRTGGYQSAIGGTERYPIGDSYSYPLPGRSFFLSVRYVTER
ncbi:MAG: TonB-dependent receptor plug domain-containing protein [Polyangiaceae bacterium]